MKQWVRGIATSLIAAAIAALAAWLVPSVPDVGMLWRRYWPVVVGVAVGAVWFVGYRARKRFTALDRRVSRLEE